MSNLLKIGFVIAVLVSLSSLVQIWNYRFANGVSIGYEDGFIDGNSTGYLDGFNHGNNKGYDEGKTAGNVDGSLHGYSEGYIEGYDIGYALGESEGYSSGLVSGKAVWDSSIGYQKGVWDGAKGFSFRDPTYKEVIDFIQSDKTNEISNFEGASISLYYAAVFKENANLAGLRCFWVCIRFASGSRTDVNAFNTTDEGLIFIDPMNDKFVLPIVGEPYYDRTLYSLLFDDTVIKYDLIP